MSNLYRAYSAVHNSEISNQLNESRDLISGMQFNQMNSVDLQEVAEEILEEMFEMSLDINQTSDIITDILSESLELSQSNLKAQKIDSLAEAFDNALENGHTVERFLQYRRSKKIQENFHNISNEELGTKRLHEALIAQNRKNIKEGILSLVEKKVKDSSYLETNMKKRQENNEKARKDMEKMGTSMKNPHFEEMQKESSIMVSPGGRMGKDDKSSMDAHGKAGNMGGSLGRKREDEKNKRMSSAAKDPLKKQQQMNRSGRTGLDRMGTVIKSVQDKKEVDADKAKTDAEKRRAKLKKKFGKSINVGMREEWASAYASIYEKKLAAPDHDPVGQEDKDIDNDGDHDKTDKYLLNRRKVIGKAMGKKGKCENCDGKGCEKCKDMKEGYKEIDQAKKNRMFRRAGNLSRDAISTPIPPEKRQDAHKKSSKIIKQLNKLNSEGVQFSEKELKAFEEITKAWED